MTDIEITDRTSDRKPEKEKVTKAKSADDDQPRWKPFWWWVSLAFMLLLYAVSIYFAVKAIVKYATQDISTTIAYNEATVDKPIAFPAMRICPLSNKKDLTFQRLYWLPSNWTNGKKQAQYLIPANLKTVVNPPPYNRTMKPTRAGTPTPAPTNAPTTKNPTTLSPTEDTPSPTTAGPTEMDETFSPTPVEEDEGGYGDYTYDYDYVPEAPPDDYSYDKARAQLKDANRNCFVWNDSPNPPMMSGNKKDSVYMIVDVDLPKKNAKFNTTNCAGVKASLGPKTPCENNSRWLAVDSSSDAMGLELTLYPQGADYNNYTTLFIPAATLTKLRMQAKKTNKFDGTTQWDFESTTSQVFFPVDANSSNPQIDIFTATQPGIMHVATVDQLVFLEIKFGDLSVLEITEGKTYEAFNAFGDATAIFGFFTGFALWGGMNIYQVFILIATRLKFTKKVLFED